MSEAFGFINAAFIGQAITAALWVGVIIVFWGGHSGDVNHIASFLAYAVPSSVIGALVHRLGKAKA